MARNKTQSIRQLQRSFYDKAKQEKEVKFYSLYDKRYREAVLWESWRQVKANQGAPGVDGTSIEAIVSAQQAAAMIQTLREQLQQQRYRFQPVRRVEIPKPQGSMRPLRIATVADRVVQTAMKLVIEPLFEAACHDCSYGYRPKRHAKMASLAIQADLMDRAWGVVEIDFQNYFTTIPHDKLMVLIKERVVDGSMLRLTKQSLKVGEVNQGEVQPTTVGVPQGSPLSPLYSNIYLNLLDRVWHSRGYPEQLGATLHRYADDVVLVCRQDATPALAAFESIVTRMGLTLNREKTRITKLSEGFAFVGFQFVRRRHPRQTGQESTSSPANPHNEAFVVRLRLLPNGKHPSCQVNLFSKSMRWFEVG